MEKLLLVLVIVLAIIGIAQLAKVYQLSSELGKKKEEDISPVSNKVNANLMFIFMIGLFASFIWLLFAYGDKMLPVAASEHGEKVDLLLNFNWAILFFVFFVVNFLLFYFSKKYSFDPKRKAYYLAHNNKLELIWTVIPSIVLAIIIIYGLRTWNEITSDPSDDAIVIELYAKQFDWTARYAGNDNKLGYANFTMISTQNPLGIITKEGIDAKVVELLEEISKIENKLKTEILPDSQVEELEDRIAMRKRQIGRIMSFQESERDFSVANDDILVKGEFHIPVNKEVNFQIRSRDVIHSAYMPHFRAQMNAVPGMNTEFTFTPTITTDSMRTVVGDENFNFILLCNKVCGSAHFNMQMNIIVDTEEDYWLWVEGQKTFVSSEKSEEEQTIIDVAEEPVIVSEAEGELSE
jgi:cytochrome c oxidase subunit 2